MRPLSAITVRQPFRFLCFLRSLRKPYFSIVNPYFFLPPPNPAKHLRSSPSSIVISIIFRLWGKSNPAFIPHISRIPPALILFALQAACSMCSAFSFFHMAAVMHSVQISAASCAKISTGSNIRFIQPPCGRIPVAATFSHGLRSECTVLSKLLLHMDNYPRRKAKQKGYCPGLPHHLDMT